MPTLKQIAQNSDIVAVDGSLSDEYVILMRHNDPEHYTRNRTNEELHWRRVEYIINEYDNDYVDRTDRLVAIGYFPTMMVNEDDDVEYKVFKQISI